MLHNRELAQHLRIIHLNHALIHLSPSTFDPGDIEKNRTMLPEWPGLDIVDEADGGEVHVASAFEVDCGFASDVGGARGTREGTFGWHGFAVMDRGRVLGGTEDVGEEEVVV